jgi:signal transduction histidine kinase
MDPYAKTPAETMPTPLSNVARLPEAILDQEFRGLVITDADWRIRYVNRPVARAVSRSPEDLLGEHLIVALNKIPHRGALDDLQHALVRLTISPPENIGSWIVPVKLPERKFLRVHSMPFSPPGHASGYLLSFTDATREGEIDEMKTDFISVASHEMRTPMTSIKGSIELLLGGYAGELPPESTELLGICLTAVDRLIRLINDLLDISKIESGKMELHLAKLNVTDCVNKSMRSLRSLAEVNKVTVQAKHDERLPEVMADRDRLEQVITNLLSNALKYSPTDKEVVIRVAAVDNFVRISVSDEGPGIPPDQVGRVFDRFQQLAGAKKGTGLGLAIARALVEQHRGRMWVESQLGLGTSFYFEIPAISGE